MSLALREALSRTLLLASDSDVIGDNRVSEELGSWEPRLMSESNARE